MEQRIRQILLPAVIVLLCLALARFALPLLLPGLLGIAFAAALRPLSKRIQRRSGFRQSISALLAFSGVLAGLALLLWLLGRLLLHEMELLYAQLPSILTALTGFGTLLGTKAERIAAQIPGGAGDAFRSWAEALMGSGGTLAERLYGRLFDFVSGLLSGLPNSLFFGFTTILASFFAATELPRIMDLFDTLVPQKQRKKLRNLGTSLQRVLGSWLRAQLKLMSITFVLLLSGFLILGVRMPLLPALAIALLDALPLFGTGTILIPWGLFTMVTGHLYRGIGLLLLYATAALTRNVLEPRFLGAQIGISPLLTLFSIYVGYRLFGVGGMLLLPICTMLGAEVLRFRYFPNPQQEGEGAHSYSLSPKKQ